MPVVINDCRQLKQGEFMKTIDLTTDLALANITAQNKWVLVKFSAKWCEPCQLLEPVFNTLVSQRPEMQAVKVNVDLQPELTRSIGIRSVPTLVLFKQGQVAGQLSGLQTEIQMNAWLDQHIQPV